MINEQYAPQRKAIQDKLNNKTQIFKQRADDIGNIERSLKTNEERQAWLERDHVQAQERLNLNAKKLLELDQKIKKSKDLLVEA